MSQTPPSGQAPRIHDDPGAPARRVLRPLARGARAALRERRAAAALAAAVAARTQAPRGGHDRPQRGRLPADLAPLLLALLRRRGHLRARQRDHRRLDRRRRASSASRSRTTASTTCGWPRRSPGFQHRAARALRRRPGHRRRRDPRAADPSGARSAPTSTGSTRSSSTARLRAPPPARPRAAARPGAPGARPARLLVRQRRLRQAGAGDRADDLGARLSHERRRAPQPTIPTCA